jgi:hypothetical protein
MYHENQIQIWFFIGLLLIIYGILVLGCGIYNVVSPPEHPVKLANLHMDIWWGILLLAVGLFYVIRFRPNKGNSGQGK